MQINDDDDDDDDDDGYRTEMNTSQFGVKRSKVKVTVE